MHTCCCCEVRTATEVSDGDRGSNSKTRGDMLTAERSRTELLKDWKTSFLWFCRTCGTPMAEPFNYDDCPGYYSPPSLRYRENDFLTKQNEKSFFCFLFFYNYYLTVVKCLTDITCQGFKSASRALTESGIYYGIETRTFLHIPILASLQINLLEVGYLLVVSRVRLFPDSSPDSSFGP
jgi:hypothetical protein